MSVFKIAWADIKKRKSAAVSLAILVTLCALLMNVGLSLTIGAGDYFDRKSEELGCPHNIEFISGNLYMPEYLDYFLSDERVAQAQVEEVVAMDVAKTRFGEGTTELAAVFVRADTDKVFLPFEPLEAIDVPDSEAIYIPLGMKAGSPALGEPFSVTYKNREYTFTVAGYFQTPVMGTSNTIGKYFLGDGAFERLTGEIGSSRMISVLLKDKELSEQLHAEFKKATEEELGEDKLALFSYTYDLMKSLALVLSGMYSSALLAFAGIILAVVLLITRFRIASNIEDNMANIGAMGAMGYTSRQIIGSMLAEFVLLAAIGTAAGTALSYALMPLVGEIVTGANGLVWQSGSGALSVMICAAFILAFVLVVSLLSSLRIRKLKPVEALSGGHGAHTFIKNRFPLDKKGAPVLLLSLKQAAANWKQGALLAAVYAFVSFTVLLSLVLYTNMVSNQDALLRMLGVEIPDVLAEVTNHTDADALAAELSKRPDVRGVSMSDMVQLKAGGVESMFSVSDDFSLMEVLGTYKGDMPRYANEAAISGVMADMMETGIGGTVRLKYHGVESEYLITGLIQGTNMMGMTGLVTLEGLRRLDPFYQRGSVNVNLTPDTDVQGFIEELESRYCSLKTNGTEQASGMDAVNAGARRMMADMLTLYGIDSVQYALYDGGEIVASGSSDEHRIERIQDYRARLRSQTYSLSTVISQLSQAIIAFSAVIIGLILVLLIRSVVQKQRRQLGVFMAIGYTPRQLSAMIAASLLPAAAAGMLIGTALGLLYVEPMFSTMFYSLGINNARLNTDFAAVALMFAVILTFSGCVAFAALRRIRGISVYELLSE